MLHKKSHHGLTHFFKQPVRLTQDYTAGKTLGVISIAIGLTELLFPKKIEKTMGLSNGQTTGVIRTLGVREILHGIDILAHHDPTPGVWGRIAGDLLDSIVLGVAATRSKKLGGFAAIAALVLPVVIADIVVGARLTEDKYS